MKITEINVLEEIDIEDPIFIEALPGIGHTGKLAADHMIDELNATKFAEIYSPSFPPQVFVGDEGIIEDMINELYYVKDVGEDKLNFIFLVGNTQGMSPEGQYGICTDVIDFIKPLGVKKLFTLGGMATGQPVENPTVYGAATDSENIEILKEHDIKIRSNDGGIVGASGLFLGIGRRNGMKGSCLMAETPGYFIDAEAAEAILLKLSSILNFEINTDKLEERAQETREMLSQVRQMEQEVINNAANADRDDLRYIG